jgi:hypothetical protein
VLPACLADILIHHSHLKGVVDETLHCEIRVSLVIPDTRKVRLANGKSRLRILTHDANDLRRHAHVKMKKSGSVDGLVGGVTRASGVERFYIPMMTIGPYTLENVIMMVPAEGRKRPLAEGHRRGWDRDPRRTARTVSLDSMCSSISVFIHSLSCYISRVAEPNWR